MARLIEKDLLDSRNFIKFTGLDLKLYQQQGFIIVVLL